MSAKRRGLGRGLDALLKPQGEGERMLPLAQLKPNRLQPRVDFEETGIEELAASIRSQGLVQPIVVTPGIDGTYTIIAGERRWRAARRAGLEEVPVVVREVVEERQLLEMALVENLQRADLNPIEEAEAYRSLREEFGLSQEEIGARVGKSRATISNTLRLLGLPDEVVEMLRQGRLTAGQARPLLALKGDEERSTLARRAASRGLSARQVEERVAGRGKERKKPKPAADADTREAAERLTRRLQARVEIVRRTRGGFLKLHFHSEEELMRLYEILSHAGGKK